MTMRGVQTVLGEVSVDALGVVDAHDHLLIRPGLGPTADSELQLLEVSEAIDEAEAFGKAGGDTILDAMPTACGRDIGGLVQISKNADIHVIATSGYHKADYYPEPHWANYYDHDQQVNLLIDEIRKGIDRYDYRGPAVQRSNVLPGVLKVGSSYNAIRPLERRFFEVVADVQLETGLPILTHTDHGTCGHEQLDLLTSRGVDPQDIALSHIDRNPDPGLHASLARRGAYLIHDGFGRECYRPLSSLVKVIERLVAEGLTDQLMLGGDVARRSLRRTAGGAGIAGLLTRMRPALQDGGIDAAILNQALRGNPAQWLVREPPHSKLNPEVGEQSRGTR